MKSKGLTYGLLVVVGIIWYQVFVRVKSNFTAEENQVPPARSQNLSKSIHKPKEFILQANFQDPFHTGRIEKKSKIDETINAKAIVIKTPQKKIKPQVFWPTIQYFGFVKSKASSNPRAIVSIDGHLFKLREGEEVFDNIRIVKATEEDLMIKYQGQIRVFEK